MQLSAVRVGEFRVILRDAERRKKKQFSKTV